MKNLSLILNGVLIVAVAFLFYEVQSLKPAAPLTANGETNAETKPVIVTSATNLGDAKIAYVNTDSLNEQYDYITDFTKDLKRKKSALEAQMESMTIKLQNDYQAYQQSAQAGIAPPAELMKTEESLKRQQQDLANKELQMQNLALELEEKNMELNKNVKEFLQRYNNGRFDYILSYSDMMPTILLTNPKLNITADVLKGLNEEYKAKKATKK